MIHITYIFLLISLFIITYISSLYDNFKERINKEYITNIIINTIILAIILIPLFYINFNIKFPSFLNIIITFLVLDMINYFWHYISHEIPYIKKFHSIHHIYSDVVPLDILHLDTIDFILFTVLTMLFPLLWLNNLVEYVIIILIIYINNIIIHSNITYNLPFFINAKYHTLHHDIGNVNYAIFFSIWDDYMGTRIKDIPDIDIKNMTIDEFKEECNKGKKLTIINNQIIDCTEWINIHPGGKSNIENIIGKDSTDDFNKMHGSSNMAKNKLKNLKLGDIIIEKNIKDKK